MHEFLGLYCEEHSPTRIVSALHHHIPCFTRVDGLVVSLPLKNSWVRVSCTAAPPYRRYLKQNSGSGIAFGIRSSLPQATSHVWSSVDASGLQALHHEAHGMLSSPCKARWAWSSRRQQPLIHGQRRHVYGSKSCEGAPRTAASYALFHRVMGLFGSVAKNSGYGLQSWDSGRAPPPSTNPCMFFCLMLLPRRHSTRGHGNIGGAF